MSLFAWDEAIPWLQMAVLRSPRFPAALFQLGRCFQETDRIKQALEVSRAEGDGDGGGGDDGGDDGDDGEAVWLLFVLLC
jgi:hypothetical protein